MRLSVCMYDYCVSAACGITGVVVWVINTPEYHYPSWSFGLTVFAVTLNITAAILLIPDVREYDYKDHLKVQCPFIMRVNLFMK